MIERTLTREQIAAVHEVVDRRAVGVAFQPIVDLRRRAVFVYEALARNESPCFSGPVELFAAAAEARRVGELGRVHYAAGHDLAHKLF